MEDDGGGPEQPEAEAEAGAEAGAGLRFQVYRRRWFALLVLCLLNCSNATVRQPRSEASPSQGGSLLAPHTNQV